MAEQEDNYRCEVPPTRWPDSLPRPDEEQFISICIGNSSIVWSIHQGEEYEVGITWKTNHMEIDDFKESSSAVAVLNRYIPEFAQQLIFGKDQDGTAANALEAARHRASHLLSVYFLSTNDKQAERVAYCFKEIPSRCFMLKPNDFFKKSQGRYETMGVDRCSTLRAAGEVHGFPILVIDGGTSHTYTAADKDGNVMGGGIGLGLESQCQYIEQQIPSTNLMWEDILEKAREMVEKEKKLDLFARDTESAIAVSILSQQTHHLRAVIKDYLLKVGPGEANEGATDAEEDDETKDGDSFRKVVFTGGAGEALCKLLDPTESEYFAADPKMTGYKPVFANRLITQGVKQALCQRRVKEDKKKSISRWDQLFIGKRIAKEFEPPDENGDNYYRGTVSHTVVNDESKNREYSIRYDDGDNETMDLSAVCEALQLYHKVGEKVPDKPSESLTMVTTKKREKSKEVADAYLVQSERTSPAAKKKAGEKKRKEPPSTTKSAAPPAKKPAPVASPIEKSAPKTENDLLGERICKFFGEDLYFGIVDKYYGEDDGDYHVTYDDGDNEDLDPDELKEARKLYKKNKAVDPKK